MTLSVDNRALGNAASSSLISEANHRIANSMASIAAIVRLHAQDDSRVQQLRSPAEVRNLLEEIGARIDAAAHLHRLLAETDHGAALELSGFLLNVARSTLNANGGLQGAVFTHNLEAGCILPSDQALTVGLLVAEMITNALKYAHPTGVMGHIAMSCRRERAGIVIRVADDGVGLPEGFDPEAAASLGFRVMRGLAAQLEGNLKFTQGGIGLEVSLAMPCPAEVSAHRPQLGRRAMAGSEAANAG